MPFIPKRTFTTEFFVGIFSIVTLGCAGWLAVGLGDINILPSDTYLLDAEFENVSGLKEGASVEIAGVPVGKVVAITLKDPEAVVRLELKKAVKIQDDDIAAIRTKGIIGDRYVKISRGSSEVYLNSGESILETESVVDIEDIIGKLIHSISGPSDKDSEDDELAKPGEGESGKG
jgi:phospholipid/cholesterol/gamma-HCH transport system substrate-binding protein